MKKKIITYTVLLGLFFVSCSDHDFTSATNKDVDRVAAQIDLSNATVAQWYNDFNMGLLFEFNKNLDFAYVAGSDEVATRWENAEVPQVSTLFDDEGTGEVLPANREAYNQYKNDVVTLLQENVMKYFKPNSTIASLMPYKVLVSYSIFLPGNVPGEASLVITESESRFSADATAQLRTVYNDNSIMFSADLEDIGDVDKFSKDNFYIFLSRIMGMHNLYDLIPDSFYGIKSSYYGFEMEPVFRDEQGIEDEKLIFVIDKDWFYEKGFIDSKNFYESGIGTIYQNYDEDGNYLGVIGRITHLNAIAPDDEFVANREVDVRSYLNEMIHRDSDEILAYPQNIQDNMKILLDLFIDWGVDMVAVNPALEVLN